MIASNPNERLLRFLQSTPEQQQAIDKILAGDVDLSRPEPKGPLLVGMGEGAKFLGVSRATLWRMIKVGRLAKVEVLKESFRLRRADLEALAAGKAVSK